LNQLLVLAGNPKLLKAIVKRFNLYKKDLYFFVNFSNFLCQEKNQLYDRLIFADQSIDRSLRVGCFYSDSEKNVAKKYCRLAARVPMIRHPVVEKIAPPPE